MSGSSTGHVSRYVRRRHGDLYATVPRGQRGGREGFLERVWQGPERGAPEAQRG